MTGTVTLGVDITPDRQWATIGVAGECRDGGVALEVIDHRGGVRWVVQRLLQLRDDHDPKAILLDPRSGAGSLIRPLTQAGVDVVEVPTADHVRACGDLFDAVVNHEISHRHQPELDAAVAGATKRTVGDAWLWDRRAGTVISPLVALTLARWGHLELPDPPPPDSDFYTL
jgi:phage terminase large subunit-like protein